MKNKIFRADFVVLGFLSIIAYLLVRVTLYIGFNIDDDHQFITINNQDGIFYKSGENWPYYAALQKIWFEAGRFFPLLISIIFLKAKLIGSNYFLHHFIVFFSGVLSAFYIYKIAKIKGFSTIVGITGALVFYTGNEYGEIFWRLICGEGPGVLFYVIGCYYTLKYFKTNDQLSFGLSLIFVTLAALTKESFILLMPVTFILPLIGFSGIAEVRAFILKYRKIYLISSVLFILMIIGIAFMLLKVEKMFDYGSPLSLGETILNNLYYVFKWFIPFSPIILVACFLAIKHKAYQPLLQLTGLTLLWIAAHILIYHKVIISYSMGKYIMPGGLVLIIILTCSLEFVRIRSSKVFKVCLILVGLVLIRNAKITYINANAFAAKVESFNKLINTTIESGDKYISVNGGAEFYGSIECHFKIAGYFPIIYSSKAIKSKKQQRNKYQNSAFEEAIFDEVAKNYPRRTIKELGADSMVRRIIIAEPLEAVPLDEAEITNYFPHKHEVITYFNNPKFSDLLNPATWSGTLRNDSVAYVYFSK